MHIKVMIIDGHADFRTLLMHHVTTQWPDAAVSLYDPTVAGHLPDEFSGAGNDVVLLGDNLGNRGGLQTLKRFLGRAGFPPVVYFCSSESIRSEAVSAGAHASFLRMQIRHGEFIASLNQVIGVRRRSNSADSPSPGDENTEIQPSIKGYRFLEKLSANEYSTVYLAESETVGGRLVLKVLRQVPDFPAGGEAFDRFLEEYEMIASLRHPNIVEIYDLGVSDDHAHIAMEYLPGGDLRSRISAGMAPPFAKDCLRQIASALAKIHSLNILHRDLKPANLMLREDDSIAMIDFGIAKRMQHKQSITDSGGIFGTPYYMSPEQGHAAELDARSDIYSLGVIFYEMLTGRKPYTASTPMNVIYKHRHAPIPRLPGSIGHHQELLNKLLAKVPDDRMQSAAEIVEWL